MVKYASYNQYHFSLPISRELKPRLLLHNEVSCRVAYEAAQDDCTALPLSYVVALHSLALSSFSACFPSTLETL